jgi:hypothetical protein
MRSDRRPGSENGSRIHGEGALSTRPGHGMPPLPEPRERGTGASGAPDSGRSVASHGMQQSRQAAPSLALAGDCESGGGKRERGTAGRNAHALPMQAARQDEVTARILIVQTRRATGSEPRWDDRCSWNAQRPYDAMCHGYADVRRPDPRIALPICAGLGDASSVVNIGAGTGSYESPERAVEPSAVMIARAPVEQALGREASSGAECLRRPGCRPRPGSRPADGRRGQRPGR